MCHLTKLQFLNISGNVHLNLLDIRFVFENLTELQSLSIADVNNLPLDIFVPLKKLQSLNISGTRMGNETGLVLEPLEMLKVNKYIMDFFLKRQFNAI
jgi:hypothetical protein